MQKLKHLSGEEMPKVTAPWGGRAGALKAFMSKCMSDLGAQCRARVLLGAADGCPGDRSAEVGHRALPQSRLGPLNSWHKDIEVA